MNREEFLAWCVVKRRLGANSMKHTRIRYDVLFRWLGDRPLTIAAAKQFILYLREKGLANPTLNSYVRVINLIDIYERDHFTDLNLLKDIDYFPKERRIPTILTPKEVDAILRVIIPYNSRQANFSSADIDKNYHLATWVIFATGCRLNEAVSLRKQDIILAEESYVKFAKTKNHDSRTPPIPFNSRLVAHLANKKPTDLAFTTSRGNKISPQSMEEDWKRRIALANITKTPRLHDARNSFIMEHIRLHTQHYTLSNLVGHNDPKSTIYYAKFDQGTLQEAAQNHHLFKKTLTLDQKLQRYAKILGGIRHEIEEDIDLAGLMPLLNLINKYLRSIKSLTTINNSI